MYDSGGDGWQGARYVVYNSSILRTAHEDESGTLIYGNGTLEQGFSGHDWMCLPDGCYELYVGGGAADSEVGFEFVDEVGGHFQDLQIPSTFPVPIYEQPANDIVSVNNDQISMPGTEVISGNDARTFAGWFKTDMGRDSYNVFQCGTVWSSCGITFAFGRWFGEFGTSSDGLTIHTWCGGSRDPVGRNGAAVSADGGVTHSHPTRRCNLCRTGAWRHAL